MNYYDTERDGRLSEQAWFNCSKCGKEVRETEWISLCNDCGEAEEAARFTETHTAQTTLIVCTCGWKYRVRKRNAQARRDTVAAVRNLHLCGSQKPRCPKNHRFRPISFNEKTGAAVYACKCGIEWNRQAKFVCSEPEASNEQRRTPTDIPK